jgi:phage/plasmid-associated DNA primase
MERRLVIISFNNRFVSANEYGKYIEPEKSGVYLAEDDDELMNAIRAEKAQILNYFIKGLQEIMNNNWQLGESENTKITKQDYVRSNDTVGTWLTDNYMVDQYQVGPIVTVSQLLQEYREWYAQNVSTRSLNYSSVSMGMKVKDVFRIESERIFLDGKKQSTYRLIKIIDEEKNDNAKTTEPPESLFS